MIHPPATSKARTARALAAALAGSVLALSGCNIVAPIAMIVSPPPTYPAQHTLDANLPTLIFVDDRSSRLPRAALRQAIAEEAQNLLLKEANLKNVIDCRAAYVVTSRDRVDDVTPLVDLGKAVQARIIVYVSIDRFTLSEDGQQLAPIVAMRAKVLDVEKESDPRVWPPDQRGVPVTATIKVSTREVPKAGADLYAAQNAAAKQAGKAIAQLFFTHRVDQSATEGR
ncbi:MAG: hypothetical protein AB7Q00_08325 [Phycisphaerales bacterium]